MNIRGLQSSFTAGELSPKLLGQVDFAQYQFGCEILENSIVWPQGMSAHRPGTRFIAAAKDAATRCRLLPFEFSTTQAYIIEASNGHFRFYKDQAQILDGGNPYEIDTPYLAAELAGLNYTQSADILYLVHGNHAPAMLSRTGHTSWTLADITFVDGPYLAERTDITITPSATTGNITLTASAPLFQPGHIGAFFRIRHTTNPQGYAKVTGYTSDTVVSATVVSAIASASASTAFSEGAWSSYRGFPTMVGFYENRLFFGATAHQPQTLWGSKSGDYYNHTPGANDDDPIAITLNSDNVNAIKWMTGSKVLLVGTTRGQWHISPTGSADALTPSNLKAVQETGLTSSAIAMRSDHTTLFWQAFGRALMEVSYSLESDAYVATPLTVLAEHIGQSPIQEMAYIQEPLGCCFNVRADGQIAVLTYERQHKVVAWTRLVTDGLFESVAKIPGTDRDEIWVCVKRTIDGNTVRYVELLEDLEIFEGAVEDLFYVDSGLTYSGAPATVISGLDHLEGKEVAILADGAVHAPLTVASGAITLSRAASKVQVGLPYTGTTKPVRQEIKAQGTVQNRRQRTVTVGIRFYKSYGGKVGERLDRLDIIPFRQIQDRMDATVTLFTGDKRVQVPGSLNRDGQVYIIQDLPLPMNLLALMPKIDLQP